jgi:hypothetical protein
MAGIYRITHSPTGWRYIGAGKHPEQRLTDHQRHLRRCIQAPQMADGWVRRLWALLLLLQHDGAIPIRYIDAVPSACNQWWATFYRNKLTWTTNGYFLTDADHITPADRWRLFAGNLPPLHAADFAWQVVEQLPCHGPTLRTAEMRWAAIGSELNPPTHKPYGNHSGRREDWVAMGWGG